MKNLLLTAGLATLLFVGCAKKPIMLTTPCPKQTKEDLIQGLTSVLMSEALEVKLVNEKLGLLQAESAPDYSAWTGSTTVNKWSFTIKEDGTVQAYANSYSGSQNAFGATTATSLTPYDDKVHEDHTWYWNVRNKLQELCGNQITFIEGGKTGASVTP